MPIRFVFLLTLPFLTGALLSGCASTRQIAIDHPATEPAALKPLQGFDSLDGDDYYVRLVSEFEFKGDSPLKSGCGEMRPSYEKGALSSALVFHVRNDVLRFNHDAAGFLYQASTGKCNFSFDAKKNYLTPWMRLDSAQETRIDYSFITSANTDVNVSKAVGDINAASNLLMFTGVGTGVAIMGKLATSYVAASQQQPAIFPPPTAPQPAAATPPDIKRSAESHSLPAPAALTGSRAELGHTRFEVYQVAESGLNPFGPKTTSLGELRLYPETTPSLLLKTGPDAIPDAHDLSLEEIWRAQINTGTAEITSLQELITRSGHSEQPNLQPNWDNYAQVESDCRKLKIVLRDLGFNKFDRNAVLYYFLDKHPDWRNYNLSWEQALSEEMRQPVLEKHRTRNFSNCLSPADYGTMKAMGLSVNTDADWTAMLRAKQKKEKYLGPLKSIERQLVSLINNPNPGEIERQAYPLISTQSNGPGTVLLQNHLGDIGLEEVLELPAIAGEGVVINAAQLARVLSHLSIGELSCARPARAQDKALGNMGILLFTPKLGGTLSVAGALEFEFADGRINRLSIQNPIYRDFIQHARDFPEIGGCRIDPVLLKKFD